MIDDGVLVMVDRAIRESKGAEAVIFAVDTPGGRVDSAIEIADRITDIEIPTLAYINGMGAISAGALISYACDEMIMEDGSNIGASTPIAMSAEGAEAVGEKMTSYVRAKYRALAELNGYNPDIAQAMADDKIELRGRLVDGKWDIYQEYSDLRSEDSETRTVSDRGAAQNAVEALEDRFNMPLEPLRELARDFDSQQAENESDSEDEFADESESIGPTAEDIRFEDGSYLILREGELLTWTPSEAYRYGLITNSAGSVEQAVKLMGYPEARVVKLEPSWSERLYKWLISPAIAGILLMVGLGGLYLEIKTPGIGLPGIIGAIALTIFLGSRTVVGLADWLDILLIVVGFSLILVELFAFPGFGIIGGLGLLSLVSGMILTFTWNDFFIPQMPWQVDRLKDAGQAMSIALVLFIVFVAATWKILPRTPLYGAFVLADTQLANDGYTVQLESDAQSYVGLSGTATSILRPAGRGRFDNKTLSVVSRGEFIEKGSPVVIVGVDGNRYIVDPIREKA
jgi:membrane-bound serine protease (ClpP class)